MHQSKDTIVHRRWDRDYPLISHAEGIYLYDEAGHRYIDGSGGSSVVINIGHGVAEVIDAMRAQAEAIALHPAHVFTHEPGLRLGELIASLAPGGMRDHCKTWLTCSGSDATDDAIRLARQYFVEQGKWSKHQVISRWEGFHGNNMGVTGVSGHTFRRRIFMPMMVSSPHIPPAYCYRCYFEQRYPQCGLLCARALETEIRHQGPENVAAFIAEPVVGAALGAVPAPEGYFELIRDICDRYDVLLIADEVMTGWGRTGRMFGMEHSGVDPDIIATAKGIGSGYTPLAAVIAPDEIWAPLQANNSPFRAGHTMNANPVSCAAGVAVLEYLLENDLVSRAEEQGAYFLARLPELLDHPIVGDVRGQGLLLGFELVQDAASGQPFPPELRVSQRVEEAAFQRGLVIYSCTGSAQGTQGDMILIAPPLIITRSQIDDMMEILHQALAAVTEELVAE